MKNTVRISVIMSVYNPKRKDELFDSVQSIMNQTFQEWEMILYDDGSEEMYIEVIKEAASMDSRIRYIRSETNCGLAYGLNRCIEASRGEYIARMDADDISKPERLEKLYKFLNNDTKYDWAGSLSEHFDENGVWCLERLEEVPGKKDFLSHSPYIHPSVVFRKVVLEKMNGYKVSKETRRCEDYELFMRLHEAGYRGYNMQEPLLLYREDKRAFQKRKYRYRVREMKIRREGFQRLGILRIDTLLYVIKPLVVGMIPAKYLYLIKKRIQKGELC